MPKIEIIIKENGVEHYISAEKLTIVSDPLESRKIALLLEDAFHAGGTVGKIPWDIPKVVSARRITTKNRISPWLDYPMSEEKFRKESEEKFREEYEGKFDAFDKRDVDTDEIKHR